MAEARRSKVDALGRDLVPRVAAEPTRAWSELLAIERIVKNTGLTMPPCGVPL